MCLTLGKADIKLTFELSLLNTFTLILFTGHVGSVYALAVLTTPGRIRLFSGSYDKTIRVCVSKSKQFSMLYINY